jgi:hypothetical protein
MMPLVRPLLGHLSRVLVTRVSRVSASCAALGFIGVAGLALTGCPAPPSSRSETLDPSTLPQEVRGDYEIFAQRCSKCHSLARPLNSGIVDDNYWAMYVARMRRQPASGISVEDARVILRFLHYYSLEEMRKKGQHDSDRAPPPAETAPPAPPATTPPATPAPNAPNASRGDAG